MLPHPRCTQVEEEADSVPKRWQAERPGEPTRVFSNATLLGLRHSGVPVGPARGSCLGNRARLLHSTGLTHLA